MFRSFGSIYFVWVCVTIGMVYSQAGCAWTARSGTEYNISNSYVGKDYVYISSHDTYTFAPCHTTQACPTAPLCVHNASGDFDLGDLNTQQWMEKSTGLLVLSYSGGTDPSSAIYMQCDNDTTPGQIESITNNNGMIIVVFNSTYACPVPPPPTPPPFTCGGYCDDTQSCDTMCFSCVDNTCQVDQCGRPCSFNDECKGVAACTYCLWNGNATVCCEVEGC